VLCQQRTGRSQVGGHGHALRYSGGEQRRAQGIVGAEEDQPRRGPAAGNGKHGWKDGDEARLEGAQAGNVDQDATAAKQVLQGGFANPGNVSQRQAATEPDDDVVEVFVNAHHEAVVEHASPVSSASVRCFSVGMLRLVRLLNAGVPATGGPCWRA